MPTQPAQLDVATLAAPCDAALAKQIYTDIGTLFPSKTASDLKASFRTVETSCTTSTLATAKQRAVDYYGVYLTNYSSVRVANPAAASAAHFTRVARYVGEATTFVAQSFTTAGGIKVCGGQATGAAACTLITGSKLAGLSVAPGVVSTPKLFAIAPAENADCARENLDFVPLCFDFTVTPVTTFASPYLDVAVCPIDAPSAILSRLRLAHPDPDPDQTDESIIKIAPPTVPALTLLCDGPHAPIVSASAGPVGSAVMRLARVASSALALFAPEPLYATHAKVGGKLGSLSPIGSVDPRTFEGTFTNDTIGQDPDSIAEKGTWTDTVVSPGSILVQASLGNMTGPLVVLSQGKGACDQCPALILSGAVDDDPTTAAIDQATTGIYEVKWRSLEDKPTVKGAPFEVRDKDGRVLARLAYRTLSSGKLLTYYYYDDATASVKAVNVGTWTQSRAQDFIIRIDLNAGTTTLRIDGIAATPNDGTPADGVPFVNRKATGIAAIVADFSGIDAGLIGWDNVFITRLPDSPAAQ